MLEETLLALGIAVAGGLLAELIVRKIVPGIKGLRTKETRIGGEYDIYDSWNGHPTSVGHVTIRQSAEWVSLRAERHTNTRGEPLPNHVVCRYRGRFKDNKLNAFFWDTKSTNRAGAVVLLYFPKDTSLKGYRMYYENGDLETFQSQQFVLRKTG